MWSLALPPPEGRLEPRGRRGRRSRSDPTLLPDHPVAYHQLLRGPRWRWWRPLVSLAVLVGLLLVLFIVVFAAFAGVDALLPDRLAGTLSDDLSPITMLELDLLLGGLIPVAAGAVAIAHQVRPGWVASVQGRLRWRWLARCSLVLAPVWVLYLAASLLVEPPEPGRPAYWGLLLRGRAASRPGSRCTRSTTSPSES